MTFSVIVTVFNLGSFLDDCLESIYNASLGNDVEVIIVNDGSTELDTINEIVRLRVKYPNFIFLDKPNGGPASARNTGVSHSSGYYIIPFDADNIMRPDLFGVIKNKIDDLNSDFDVIYFNALFFGNKNFVWPDKDYNATELAVSNFIDSSACFSRVLFDRLNGFDESNVLRGFEDWDFWLRATACNSKFVFLREVLFDYRVRTGSMLDRAWPNRNQIIDYIFDKPELIDLKAVRLSQLSPSVTKNDRTFFFRLQNALSRLLFKKPL